MAALEYETTTMNPEARLARVTDGLGIELGAMKRMKKLMLFLIVVGCVSLVAFDTSIVQVAPAETTRLLQLQAAETAASKAFIAATGQMCKAREEIFKAHGVTGLSSDSCGLSAWSSEICGGSFSSGTSTSAVVSTAPCETSRYKRAKYTDDFRFIVVESQR